jgi:hypothetical protein
VHAPSEGKGDVSKVSFYKQLEHTFDHFPRYHIKILRDFNAEVRIENIFKPTAGNESLQQESNNSGVKIVNFATSKIWLLRALRKYT